MSAVDVLSTTQTVVVAVAAVLLGVAAAFTLYRMAKGPTNLDRIISSDLIVGIAVAAFGLQILVVDDETALPIMLAISLVGFIGAVAMARFVLDRHIEPSDVRRTGRSGDGARASVRGERPVRSDEQGVEE